MGVEQGERTFILVTDLYPPDAGGRAEKMESHARHWLKTRGSRVVVVVPQRGERASGLGPAGRLQVIRVPIPLRGLSENLRPAGASGRGPLSLWHRVLASHIRWLFPALLRTVAVARRSPRPVVITVSNPVSLHFIGFVSRIAAGVPWVAELRDPWGRDPAVQRRFERLHRLLARFVLGRADLVIRYRTVEGTDLRQNRRNSASELELPWFGMEQGRQPEMRRRNPPRLLVYTGQWYPPLITPDELLEIYANARRISAIDARLTIVGPWPNHARAQADRLQVTEVVQAVGTVAPDEARDWQRRADAGFVIVPPELANRGWLPSKFWDYAASRLPMIVVAPKDSLAARLTRHFALGVVVPAQAPAEAGTILAQTLAHGLPDAAASRVRLFERYTSRSRIEARILEAIGSLQARI